jgi:hypothetical protein
VLLVAAHGPTPSPPQVSQRPSALALAFGSSSSDAVNDTKSWWFGSCSQSHALRSFDVPKAKYSPHLPHDAATLVCSVTRTPNRTGRTTSRHTRRNRSTC